MMSDRPKRPILSVRKALTVKPEFLAYLDSALADFEATGGLDFGGDYEASLAFLRDRYEAATGRSLDE